MTAYYNIADEQYVTDHSDKSNHSVSMNECIENVVGLNLLQFDGEHK